MIAHCPHCDQPIAPQTYLITVRYKDGSVLSNIARWNYRPDAGFAISIDGRQYRVDRVTDEGDLSVVWVS